MITPGEASCSMTFSRTTPPMDYLTTYTLEDSNRLDGTVYLWLTDVLLMASFTVGNSLKPFMTYTSPVTAWAFIQVHTTQQLILFRNTFSLGLNVPLAVLQLTIKYEVLVCPKSFHVFSTQTYMKTSRTTFTTVLYGNTAFLLYISVDLLRWKWIQLMFFF